MDIKKKKIKLYAYRIEPDQITTNKSDLTENLIKHFNEIKENNGDRRRTINKSSKDEDILSFFKIYPGRNLVFGIIMRITPSIDVPKIPDDFFTQTSFKPSQITQQELEEKGYRCKSSYFFMVNDTHLITDLPARNAKQFEAYINWFLEVYRGDKIYQISPIINISQTELRDIKEITFGGKQETKEYKDDPEPKKDNRILNIGLDTLKSLCGIDQNLKVLIEKNILTAQIIVKFDTRKKKKEEIEDDEVKKALSAVVGNISEDSNVNILTNDNKKIKAGATHLMKDIEVDEIEPGIVDEGQLSYQMELFMSSLKGKLR